MVEDKQLKIQYTSYNIPRRAIMTYANRKCLGKFAHPSSKGIYCPSIHFKVASDSESGLLTL